MASDPDRPVPNLTRYDAILIDLDGTFYREEVGGAAILPGALDLVRTLKQRGQTFACLTNSGLSPAALKVRLAGMGAELEEGQIWSCAAATAELLLARYAPMPRIYSLASDGLHDMLEGKVAWAESIADACDAVVVAGLTHPRAVFERQWTALQILRRGTTALIGLCADRVYPSHRGLEFGSGAATHMLAYASGITPQFCGKPEPIFFHELCNKLKVKPERCILLGDNLDSDIAGAKGVGMASALVLTGVATAEHAAAAADHCRPDFVVPSLATFRAAR